MPSRQTVRASAHEVFVGFVPAPSEKIAVVTSENHKLLETDIASTTAQVRILVDQPDYPSRIWIEAR